VSATVSNLLGCIDRCDSKKRTARGITPRENGKQSSGRLGAYMRPKRPLDGKGEVVKPGDILQPSKRTRVRRIPRRGLYKRNEIYEILDGALICHVGFISDGFPHVLPMVAARSGNRLLIHGSTASRLTRTLAGGADVCVAVTQLDGVVVARAVFDNSMNYRSVVIFGRAHAVPEADKVNALKALVEHVLPGRWDEARGPNQKELRATTILALPIDEASAKVRSGPPQDDERDLALPIWAGEIPLRTVAAKPVPDPRLAPAIPLPASVEDFFATYSPSMGRRV
jgi:nitroimidazol reductase NimA-like FMN-containing flavoprotein (pyridoxamine 5'-phosphate oxidase superfamily)